MIWTSRLQNCGRINSVVSDLRNILKQAQEAYTPNKTIPARTKSLLLRNVLCRGIDTSYAVLHVFVYVCFSRISLNVIFDLQPSSEMLSENTWCDLLDENERLHKPLM